MKRLGLIALLLLACCGARAQYVVGTRADGSVATVPYSFDTDIRAIRQNAFPNFNSPYGDYIQYAPLALVPLLKACGVPTRNNWGRMASAAAFCAIFSGGVSRGLKYAVHRERPNLADNKSFPSGHTMLAFSAAHVLHKEYGWYSPWISIAGYTVALSTVVQRQATDAHWMSDTFAGAVLAIGCVELGYFLNDLIWRDKGRCKKFNEHAHYHYEPEAHDYYTIEWLYGRRFMCGTQDNIAQSVTPWRGGYVALQAELPWTRGALGSTMPGAEGTIAMNSGIKTRIGAGSLTHKDGSSYNMYNILVGGYWTLAFTDWFEAEAYPMLGAAWNAQGVGLDADLGLSANFVTGGTFKLKLFAEFEAFKIQKNSPFWASFLLGYSAGFYF